MELCPNTRGDCLVFQSLQHYSLKCTMIVAIAIVFFIVLGQLDKSEGATRASETLEVQSVLEMTETIHWNHWYPNNYTNCPYQGRQRDRDLSVYSV